jgi:uncharacterized protein
MGPNELCQIEVVQSLAARQIQAMSLAMPDGSTVQDALVQTGWAYGEAVVGIWGRKVPLDQVLQPGDRLEIYRPLQVDPKEARRQRYAARSLKPRISGNKRFKAVKPNISGSQT